MVKKVAVINDLSGLGKCSLTAAIPVLSVMGVQACPFPTAILSNQTGYESYYYDDYTGHMDAYAREWEKRGLTIDGIYTSFLGSELQAEKILNFIHTFRRPETLLLVDPVMGDSGQTYDIYTETFGKQMKKLVQRADVITPNLTELCILTDIDYKDLTAKKSSPDYLNMIAETGKRLLDLGIGTVIITGIIYQSPSDAAEKYYNLVLENEQVTSISSDIHGGSYSGTGDLLASVVCAGMVRGDSATDSVRRAVSFLETALIETAREQIPRNDGINFEPYLKLLME